MLWNVNVFAAVEMPLSDGTVVNRSRTLLLSHSTEARSKDDSMKEFIQLHRPRVPYISQSYSWDCGLACVEMALRARGVKQVSDEDLSSDLSGKCSGLMVTHGITRSCTQSRFNTLNNSTRIVSRPHSGNSE